MPRIFLVDDDPEIRELLADVLRAEGYEVIAAANGHDGLARLRGNPPPDLILLDMMMPIMNGPQFLEACDAAESLRAVPVVVLSAYECADAPVFGGRVVQYLRKPIELESLIALVERWCAPSARLVPGARSVRADAVALPGSPPPDDWGGARSYYLCILNPFFSPRAESPHPSEAELVWLLRRLEHRGFVRRGMHAWRVLVRMCMEDQNAARLAERLASYWLDH